MPRLGAAVFVLLLTACVSLGCMPGQSEISCLRTQMAPPEDLTFPAAASTCMKVVDGQSLTGAGASVLPFNLGGAPDLQANARATGYTYTD